VRIFYIDTPQQTPGADDKSAKSIPNSLGEIHTVISKGGSCSWGASGRKAVLVRVQSRA